MPPSWYICYRCEKPGHFIEQCQNDPIPPNQRRGGSYGRGRGAGGVPLSMRRQMIRNFNDREEKYQKDREEDTRSPGPRQHSSKSKGQKVCYYFSYENGCKNGSKCKFSHEIPKRGSRSVSPSSRGKKSRKKQHQSTSRSRSPPSRSPQRSRSGSPSSRSSKRSKQEKQENSSNNESYHNNESSKEETGTSDQNTGDIVAMISGGSETSEPLSSIESGDTERTSKVITKRKKQSSRSASPENNEPKTRKIRKKSENQSTPLTRIKKVTKKIRIN